MRLEQEKAAFGKGYLMMRRKTYGTKQKRNYYYGN